MTKNIDTKIKVYSTVSDRGYLSVGADRKGFFWDTARWISPLELNNYANLATHYDASTDLDDTYFRSGVGDKYTDLGLRHIRRNLNDLHLWEVGVDIGDYYIQKDGNYLYSEDVICVPKTGDPIDILAEEYTTIDIGSFHSRVPVNGYIYQRDLDTGIASVYKHFIHKQEFTPLIANGTRLSTLDDDGEIAWENVDTSENEFILQSNLEDLELGYRKFSLGNIDLAGAGHLDLSDISEDEDVLCNTVDSITTVFFRYPEDISDGSYIHSFSRTDIFVEYHSYTEFIATPGIGSWTYKDELDGILVYVSSDYLLKNTLIDFGYFTYILPTPYTALFNQNVCTELTGESLGTTAGNDSIAQYFYLEKFPVLDNTTESSLDTTSFTLYADMGSALTVMTRVTEFSGGPDEYLLNPADGIVHLPADCGLEDTDLTYDATLVPVIKYEPGYTKGIFYDARRNVNPVYSTNDGVFVTLTNDPNHPYDISLKLYRADITPGESSSDSITNLDTDVYLVATVKNRAGNPVPGAIVNFSILNEVGQLVPESGVTDSRGQARVHYIAPFVIDKYAVEVPLFLEGDDADAQPSALYIDPGPTNPFKDAVIARDTLKVETEKLYDDINPALTYLFMVLSNDELLPYDATVRLGGRYLVLYKDDGGGTNILISPTSIAEASENNWELLFGDSLPSSYPAALLEPGAQSWWQYIQKYVIISSLLARFQATTTGIFNETLYSNIVEATVELSAVAKGVWTLPNVATNSFDGSAITTATYFDINS